MTTPRMSFGVGIPTCREGLAYPSGFVSHDFIVDVAIAAEKGGFDSLWANDHLITPNVLRTQDADPPSFFEPIVTFAFLASHVTRVKFVLASVVAPLRNPLLLAKQIATLDRASDGRVVLGLASGAYREEFELIRGSLASLSRGQMIEESVRILRSLFAERSATFEGSSYRFEHVEMYPHPKQDRLPIFLSGSAPPVIRRVALLADGLIVTDVPPQDVKRLRTDLDRASNEARRSPSDIALWVQMWVAISSTRQEAVKLLRESQHLRRLSDLSPEAPRQTLEAAFAETNLLGTPADIGQRLLAYRDAGADHVGLVLLARSREELIESVACLADEVLPELAGAGGPEVEP